MATVVTNTYVVDISTVNSFDTGTFPIDTNNETWNGKDVGVYDSIDDPTTGMYVSIFPNIEGLALNTLYYFRTKVKTTTVTDGVLISTTYSAYSVVKTLKIVFYFVIDVASTSDFTSGFVVDGAGATWNDKNVGYRFSQTIYDVPAGTYYSRVRSVRIVEVNNTAIFTEYGHRSAVRRLYVAGEEASSQVVIPVVSEPLAPADFAGMEVYNKAAHLGRSRTVEHPSKWIGKIPKGQFGAEASTAYQVTNAELAIPTGLPRFHKIVVIGDYYYAIRWAGTQLFKIKIADGTYTVSEELFTSAQGLCVSPTNTLFILDYEGTGTSPVLYEVETTEATPILHADWTPVNIGGFGVADNFVNFTDIQCGIGESGDANKLYVLVGMDTAKTGFASWIFSDTLTRVKAGNALYNITPMDGQFTAVTINIPTCGGAMFPTETNHNINLVCGLNNKKYIVTIAHAFAGEQQILPVTNPYLTVHDGADMTKIMVAQNADAQYLGTISLCSDMDHVFIVSEIVGANIMLAVVPLSTLSASNYIVTNNATEDSHIDPTATGLLSQISNKIPDKVPFTMVWKATSYFSLFVTGSANTNSYAVKNITFSEATHWFEMSSTAEVAGGDILLTVLPAEVTGGYLDGGKHYYYTYSLEYDGIQESPLYLEAPAIASPATGKNYNVGVTIAINKAFATNVFSKRITAIKIYRAESSASVNEPETLYRLVESVPLEHGWTTTVLTYERGITDSGINGSSYESETGISQTLTRNYVNYEIDTQFQGFHFVARCYVPDIDDASRMVFRSKQDCFDQFDWSNDFCVLPKMPNAIVAFNGSIYAYADNESYRINPIGLYIEDIYEGVGVPTERSVVVTEFGMFLCNRTDIYHHDGKTLNPIGVGVKTISNPDYTAYGWVALNEQANTQPIVVPFLKRNTIVFAVTGVKIVQAYVYNIQLERFDYWETENSVIDTMNIHKNNGWVVGADGQVYVCGTSIGQTVDGGYGSISLASSTTRKPFTWVSKYFTMNTPDQLKKFYAVGYNDSTATVQTSTETVGTYSAYAVFEPGYFKSIIVKIIGTAATQLLNFSIQFRRMIGVR